VTPSRILVVNAGSSSLKLRVLDAVDAVVASVDLAPPRGPEDRPMVAEAVAGLGAVDAVGHRIVHGGTAFTGPVRLDARVTARIAGLTSLAPLHQPKALTALDAVTAAVPDVPAVASFDTAFHAGMPAAASTYALPAPWRQKWDLRRYGFHGLSHAYATRRAGELLGVPVAELRLVTCHLGAGASLAAVAGGRSVDTTMGFTPLEGLVMATRSGSVDPGLVLWLADHVGMPPAELASTLEHRSGLLGLAGTADMREILAGADRGDERAQLALGVYVHRLRREIAAMTASLGGLDAIVFTGGVGERSARIRTLAADGLAYLGIALDEARNATEDAGDREIGAAGASVRALVIASREDVQIAGDVRRVLAGDGGGA
jgi:acetate kinase